MNTQARHHFAKARRRERPPTLRREDEPQLRLLLPLEPTPPKARKTIPYVRRGHPSKREARGMATPISRSETIHDCSCYSAWSAGSAGVRSARIRSWLGHAPTRRLTLRAILADMKLRSLGPRRELN